MKNIIIGILFTVFFAPTTVLGQVKDYGFKLGAQSAGVYSEPSMDGRVAGFSIYGFIDWNINQRVFSTIDLGFTQRGFRNSQNETNEFGEFIQKVEATSKLSYITLAPFVNVKAPLSSVLPYFGIAPRFDLLIDKTSGMYRFSSVTATDETANFLDELVFGASFVTGIRNFVVHRINFRIEAKYEVDITDSFSEFPRDFRNNVFMVVMGVSL